MYRLLKLFAAGALTLSARELVFEPNHGQSPAPELYLTRDAVGPVGISASSLQFGEVRLEWSGAGKGPWTPLDPSGEARRYCRPNSTASLCSVGVPVSRRLRRQQLYPGIDLVLYGQGESLEYDLELSAGANPASISFQFHGCLPHLDGSGDLRCGRILHRAPKVHQQGRPVGAHIVKRAQGGFGIDLDAYDVGQPIVIDPVIERQVKQGGHDEDRFFAASGPYVLGVTRSADWSGKSGWDIFIQTLENGLVVNTVFWGGDGDEELGAVYRLPRTNILRVVGATSSSLIPTMSRGSLSVTPTRGGWDGFLLDFNPFGFNAASLGGPGDDRLYAITPVSSDGSTWAVAGETTDAHWPGAALVRSGESSGIDAIVVTLRPQSMRLWALGGSGVDRCRSVFSYQESLVLVGETDSPDFAGQASLGGRDLWWTSLSTSWDGASPPTVTRWGGSGDERFAGAAMDAPNILLLAGSTTSPKLPAASNTLAGNRDGFFVRISYPSLVPKSATFLGGPGDDEINSLTYLDGDLFLAGSTNSPSLPFPGVNLEPIRDRDALFLHTDDFGRVMYAHRYSGGQMSRWLGATGVSERPGVVELTGESDGDALRISLRFPVIRIGKSDQFWSFAPSRNLVIGQNLQIQLFVSIAGELPPDGLLFAASSDTSLLALGQIGDLSSSGTVALVSASGQSWMPLFLFGIGAEGTVDLTLEARAGSSYARRVLAVRLAPAALYLLPSSISLTQGTVLANVFAGPLLPPEESPIGQTLLPGRKLPVTLVAAEGMASATSATLTSSDQMVGVNVELNQRGRVVLVPNSSSIPAAPSARLELDYTRPNPIFPLRQQLAQEHTTRIGFTGLPGEQIYIENLDPELITINAGVSSLSLTMAPSAPDRGEATVQVHARKASGLARLRVTGMLQGAPVDVVHQFLLIPYEALISNIPSTLPVGTSFKPILIVRPLPVAQSVFSLASQEIRTGSSLSNLSLRSRNPAVARVEGALVVALSLGSTVLEAMSPTGIPAIDDIQWPLNVVNPGLDFNKEGIVLAVGSSFLYSLNANYQSGLTYRIRTSNPSIFRILDNTGRPVDELEVNPNWIRSVRLLATGSLGQTASLVASFAGYPDHFTPVRLVPTTIRPQSRVYTAIFNGVEDKVSVIVSWNALPEGSLPATPDAFRFTEPRPFRITLSNPELCRVKDGSPTNGNIYVELVCGAPGDFTVRIEADWSPANTVEPIMVHILPAAVSDPLAEPLRLGNGLQFPIWRKWATSYRSGNPSLVRLAANERDPGTVEVRSSRQVFAQGFASSGQTIIIAEGNNQREEIPIHLFPSTLMVRLNDNASTWRRSSDTILTLKEPFVNLSILPGIIEPNTGSVLDGDTSGANLLQMNFRGGTDPAFVSLVSSDPSVASLEASRILLTEDRTLYTARLALNDFGRTTISVSQPAGFTAFTASNLRLSIEPDLLSHSLVQLAPDLQTAVWISGVAPGRNVTVESLDPEKLEIAATASSPGARLLVVEPSTTNQSLSFFARALSTALPGDLLKIRVSSSSQAPLEIAVPISNLVLDNPRPSSIQLSSSPFQFHFIIGPANRFGNLSPSWGGSVRPGANIVLNLASNDPTRLQILDTRILFNSSIASARAQALRPGFVRLSLTPSVPMLIPPNGWEFKIEPWRIFWSTSSVPPYLVSPWLRLRNPTAKAVAFTLRSEGRNPVWLGTSAIGAGFPRAPELSLQLAPGEERTVYTLVNSAGSDDMTRVRISAPDFADESIPVSVGEANAQLSPFGSATIPRTQANFEGQLALTANGFTPVSAPLGLAALFEIRSSNPQVSRSGTVAILQGESLKPFSLPIVGPGETVLTLVPPPSHIAFRTNPLVVNVR